MEVNAGNINLCPGGTVTITSNQGVSSYQWQVNTGNGYVNISDNDSYGGTGTSALEIKNAPSSWYGYQYRCLVDGSPGNISILKFTNNWTGLVDNSWENPLNWSCNLPDRNSDVYINGGVVYISSDVECARLFVSQGSDIIINQGFKLLIGN